MVPGIDSLNCKTVDLAVVSTELFACFWKYSLFRWRGDCWEVLCHFPDPRVFPEIQETQRTGPSWQTLTEECSLPAGECGTRYGHMHGLSWDQEIDLWINNFVQRFNLVTDKDNKPCLLPTQWYPFWYVYWAFAVRWEGLLAVDSHINSSK